MSETGYTKWVERASVHRAAGRTIDALICYRLALREIPDGAEAQFQLGAIAWQFGDVDDALALWRRAVAGRGSEGTVPGGLAAQRALADALAMLGRFDEAADAAKALLALHPKGRRTRRLIVMLDAARGYGADAADADNGDAERALHDAFGVREPWPLALVAGVTLQLARARPEPRLPASGPASDLLHVALDAAFRTASEGPVLRGTEDALRSVALDLARAGVDDRARLVAARYEAVCMALAAGSAPACWPRRAGPGRLRVGVLRPAGARDLAIDGTSFDVAVIDVATLPHDPDAAARVLAAHDFDVLVDTGGLGHASGTVLALRPARRLWSYGEAAALALQSVTDRVFTGDAGELAAALADEAKALEGGADAGDATAPDGTAYGAGNAASPAELAARRDAAVIAHRDGNFDLARAGYDAILAQQHDDPQTLYLRAMLERSRGNTEQSLADLRAAIGAAPGYADARTALVQAMTAHGLAADAVAVARAGLEQHRTFGGSKRSASLWRALGQAELARGEGAAAAPAFAQALALEPDHADSHYNHGVAMQQQGDLDGAMRAWRRAAALDPGLAAAHYNLGVAFDRRHRAGAAVKAFTRALELAPAHVDAYKALGETLFAAGRIDDWIAHFRRFHEHCAGHIAVAPMAIEVAAWTGDHGLLDRTLDGLRHDRFATRDAGEFLDALQQLLFLLLYVDVEPELITRYARLHNDLARRTYGEPWPRVPVRRPGRLRIGYVSGDFRNHVMGKMMWEVLRQHDHAHFEVFGYTTDGRRDAWTTRIVTAFDHFADVSTMSEVAAARRIAADDLDLLVDLSTHTKGARAGVFALKPARVQITHVASAGTTGLASIDFKLTDHYADLAGSFPDDLEAPLVMEGCVYPWRHLVAAEPAAPADRGGRIVIGAFVTPLKLSQRCLALWREVLQRIPHAVLAFSPLDSRTEPAYRRLAATAGFDAARIVFVPHSGDDAIDLARYREVDFVLDPMPYGGVNGTLEPLAMGVPVVTLVGRRHGERSSHSILANLGVTETVAQTGPEYVEIAARLASDPSFMRAVRERIRAGTAGSALTDMVTHTRNLERAYVAALELRAPEAIAGAGIRPQDGAASPAGAQESSGIAQ
jgi:predicted O-linked N-acetylglucosamine transferase (SPINDLY family)